MKTKETYVSVVSTILVLINLFIIVLSILCFEIPLPSYNITAGLISIVFSSYLAISAIKKINSFK